MHFEYTVQLDLGRYRFTTAEGVEAFVLVPQYWAWNIVVWDGHFPLMQVPKVCTDIETLFPNAIRKQTDVTYMIPFGPTDAQMVWLKLAAVNGEGA